MTNGQKMRKLFEEKKLVVAPGCHDALTAKIISYLGFDAVYMTGYGQSASHLGQPDVGLMTMSEMVMRASTPVEAAGTALVVADADTGSAKDKAQKDRCQKRPDRKKGQGTEAPASVPCPLHLFVLSCSHGFPYLLSAWPTIS